MADVKQPDGHLYHFIKIIQAYLLILWLEKQKLNTTLNQICYNLLKGGSRHKNLCMRVLGFLIRYFSNYYTLHRSDLAARAAPLDPRLRLY